MKTTHLLFWLPALLFLMSSPLAAQVARELPGGYRLVWHDEFDTDGRPDPANWDYETGFVRNREWQWYQPGNAEVRDGVLVLTARSENRPNPLYEAGSKDWRKSRPDIACTSASVISRGKREFRFGRVLVRARIPASRGSWPAIWLLGSKEHYGWPSCGEIDMMEFYPKNGVRSILANACWGDDAGSDVWDAVAVPFTHFTQKDSLWATRFHEWRMDWDRDFVRLYLDDELLNEIDLSKTVNGKHGNHDNPFHKPMYLLLNLAMGSSGGAVDMHTLPVRYEVDYVRVYQKDESAGQAAR